MNMVLRNVSVPTEVLLYVTTMNKGKERERKVVTTTSQGSHNIVPKIGDFRFEI